MSSKASEGTAAPPAYSAVVQPGAGYSAQPYPTQAYPYQAPPPYAAQGDDGKTNAGYTSGAAYQTDYGQPNYYSQQTPLNQQPGTVLMPGQTVHMIPVMANPPETHMLFSVLATLCCCWPIGIFAIIKSMEVTNAISRGDQAAAEYNSKRAYSLAKAAVIAGVVCTVISVIFLIIFYAVIFNIKDFD